MFNFEDLEREISEQNAALESLLAELENEEIANESLFKNSVTVDDLLEKVKAAVEKCESCEDCEKLLDKLKDEEDKFNKCFKDMKDAAEKFKDGKIDKEELNKVIVAANEEIKKCCDLLALRDVDENADELKDADIKLLRDFLVKSREVIEEKCESFGDSDDEDEDEEEKEEKDEKSDVEEDDEEMDAKENMIDFDLDDDIATEGNNLDARAAEKEYGTKAKILAKEAKKLYKEGNYSGAKAKYEEAAGLLDNLVKEVDSLEPSVASGVLGTWAYNLKISAYAYLLAVPTLGIGTLVVGVKEMIKSIESLIAAIKAAKNGTLSVNDFNRYTNRIKQHAQGLAKEYRKAAAKCMESGKAHESYMEGYMKAIEEFCDDDFDEDGSEIATEGNNLDARAAKKRYGAEIKLLAKEAKKLYKEGNYSEAKQKFEQAADLADALVKEVDSLEPSIASGIIGSYAHSLKTCALAYLVMIPTLGIGTIAISIKEMIGEIDAIVTAIKNYKSGTLSVNDFNAYTNRIKQYGKKLAKDYRDAAKKCTEAGKAHESYMEGYMKAIEEFYGDED